MGRVGCARPMGAVVMVVATLMLLSAPAGQAISYDTYICELPNLNSVELHPHETVFLGTDSLTVNVNMEVDGCVNDTKVLDLSEFTASNGTALLRRNLKWYEFNYLSCGNYVTKIGSKEVKFEFGNLLQCSSTRMTLSVGSDVTLGRKCFTSPRRKKMENKAGCKELLKRVQDTNHSFITKPEKSNIEEVLDSLHEQKEPYDSLNLYYGNKQNPLAGDSSDDKNNYDTPEFIIDSHQNPKKSGVDQSETFINWKDLEDYLQGTPASPPSYNLDDLDSDSSYTTRRTYKENAIPIFIGIVVFTVSMCLRFCLCRGKSVVRRVTTVTVIRSHPVSGPEASQDQQDPPPSYIDVVSDGTAPQSPEGESSAEPPPPAYADIVNEVQPPSYSESEVQSTSEVPVTDQEAKAHTTQPPPDTESASDTKGSEHSESMLSKYRSRQKQFAFKVLEEDE